MAPTKLFLSSLLLACLAVLGMSASPTAASLRTMFPTALGTSSGLAAASAPLGAAAGSDTCAAAFDAQVVADNPTGTFLFFALNKNTCNKCGAANFCILNSGGAADGNGQYTTIDAMHSCVNGGVTDSQTIEGYMITIQWCKAVHSPAYYAVIVIPTVLGAGVFAWRANAAAKRMRAAHQAAAAANAHVNAPLLDGAAV